MGLLTADRYGRVESLPDHAPSCTCFTCHYGVQSAVMWIEDKSEDVVFLSSRPPLSVVSPVTPPDDALGMVRVLREELTGVVRPV